MSNPNTKLTPTPKDPPNALVVQSNPLVEARYKLPLLAQQALRLLISKIEPDTTNIDRELYRVNITEFGKLIGRSETSSLYREIKSVAKILRRTPIIIRKDNGDFLEMSWIQSFWYREKLGCIDFLFSKSLNPFLTELRRRFTQYRLDNVCRLDSQYSIRIYELIKQYASVGSRTIPLDELKIILGVGGEYDDYRNFRLRVLSPAHREVNAKTDLRYSWEPVKESRRVIAIRFYDIILSEPENIIAPESQNVVAIESNADSWQIEPTEISSLGPKPTPLESKPEAPKTREERRIIIDGKEFLVTSFIDNIANLLDESGIKTSVALNRYRELVRLGRATYKKVVIADDDPDEKEGITDVIEDLKAKYSLPRTLV